MKFGPSPLGRKVTVPSLRLTGVVKTYRVVEGVRVFKLEGLGGEQDVFEAAEEDCELYVPGPELVPPPRQERLAPSSGAPGMESRFLTMPEFAELVLANERFAGTVGTGALRLLAAEYLETIRKGRVA
jgi:hypothetical protein